MMMNKTFILTLGLLLSAGAAAAEVINCPLTQARREVTTGLPGGWWSTPIIESLSETEIMNIGGQPALICRYGSAGSVQRYVPDGATCAASATGFVCDGGGLPPPPPPGGAVHAEGEVSIPMLGAADFDGGGRADVIHFLSDGVAAALVPQNGARLGRVSSTPLGQAGCSAETLRNRPTVLADILGGGFICYKTNNGRIGEFEFLGLSGGMVSLAYTTWE
jgi:hypothetical protein